MKIKPSDPAYDPAIRSTLQDHLEDLVGPCEYDAYAVGNVIEFLRFKRWTADTVKMESNKVRVFLTDLMEYEKWRRDTVFPPWRVVPALHQPDEEV